MYTIFQGPRQKKADISLSVNTIVIIVLAITLLGLGLTFIRGIVGDSFGRLEKLIETTDLEKQPTAVEPLTISSDIEIKRNSQTTAKIGFYNKASISLREVKPTISKCISTIDGEDVTELPKLITLSKTELLPSDSVGFEATIGVEGLAEGRYACRLSIEADGSTNLPEVDFYITVTV
ncbi:MAG: hypothetical protein WC471_01595 [Candidatus Woesearchaeota archaeon]|jgi:hypothetical protein